MIALMLSLVLAQGYAPPRQGQDPLDPVREERVQQLGKQLRCAVCQCVLAGCSLEAQEIGLTAESVRAWPRKVGSGRAVSRMRYA